MKTLVTVNGKLLRGRERKIQRKQGPDTLREACLVSECKLWPAWSSLSKHPMASLLGNIVGAPRQACPNHRVNVTFEPTSNTGNIGRVCPAGVENQSIELAKNCIQCQPDLTLKTVSFGNWMIGTGQGNNDNKLGVMNPCVKTSLPLSDLRPFCLFFFYSQLLYFGRKIVSRSMLLLTNIEYNNSINFL